MSLFLFQNQTYMRNYYRLFITLLCLLPITRLAANVNKDEDCKFSDTLILNTGYNHVNGTIYQLYEPDSFWQVTALTPDCDPYALQPVPYNAIALRNLNMPNGYTWVNSSQARWIGFRPNDIGYGYPTNATGLYEMTLTRTFRTCDSGYYRLFLKIAADNSVTSLKVDGGPSLFSQTSGLITTNFNTFHTLDTIIYLPEGEHKIDVVVNNYLEGVPHRDNAHGLIIVGKLIRHSALGTIWDPLNGENCKCPPATLGVSGHNKTWINSVVNQNYPNPFDKETRIDYDLVNKDVKQASIIVVDALGRKCYEESIQPGKKSFVTIGAQQLSQGIYYYYIVLDGNRSEMYKMSVLP